MSDEQFERLVSELHSISEGVRGVEATLFYVSAVLVLMLIFK